MRTFAEDKGRETLPLAQVRLLAAVGTEVLETNSAKTLGGPFEWVSCTRRTVAFISCLYPQGTNEMCRFNA